MSVATDIDGITRAAADGAAAAGVVPHSATIDAGIVSGLQPDADTGATGDANGADSTVPTPRDTEETATTARCIEGAERGAPVIIGRAKPGITTASIAPPRINNTAGSA